MKDLPPSFLAMVSASFLRSRLWASSLTFWVWKYSRFALVARRAFFLGKRKLRAKPSLTRTSSPIWPSFSTRSSRMTCMAAPLFHDIGKQRHKAGAFDRVRQDALILIGHRGDAAGHDLAALGDVTLQQLHILVIDLGRIGAGERIGFLAPEERTPRAIGFAASAALASALAPATISPAVAAASPLPIAAPTPLTT